SAKGEHGMDVWLDKVPKRQANMAPFEILLSESQERMLIVVKKGNEKQIKEIFDKWDLNCEQIGVVTDTKRLKFYMSDQLVADVPAEDLVLGGGAPVYHREYKEPSYFKEYQKFKINAVKEPSDYKKIAEFLLKHPNIASKKWVYEQYDSMVGTANMSTNAPSDAAVVRVRGTEKSIVITVDCNSRYVNANPEEGCAIAVAEAARNIVCSGGEPVAITNCLNFGNPYNPEVYWQFVGAIKGMKKSCEKFKTPVTGGNVSFYNQSSDGGPVFPTPTIGMLGLLDKKENRMTLDFKTEGDLIYLIGQSRNDISSSEYLYSYLGIKASPAPHFDLDEEYKVQDVIKNIIKSKLIKSAHDISEGGLFVALAESAMAGKKGFEVSSDKSLRKDAFLFGESQSRVVVSVSADKNGEFVNMLKKSGVAFSEIGKVIADKFIVDKEVLTEIASAKNIYDNSLYTYLS
ncbi:MAG: phosphoribosylformylglycinamidine synthase subunit PurL, partial [Cytophagaceae bacterium]|nr:phosphoribosylformylglycinamidine synthase subunit PurL [Cytophagaceae bacterium]